MDIANRNKQAVMSFFDELKRRNVFRVGIAYVIVAWLLLQVADVVLNNIEAPAWVFQAILLLLVIGLPMTSIFAWAFELTPESSISRVGSTSAPVRNGQSLPCPINRRSGSTRCRGPETAVHRRGRLFR